MNEASEWRFGASPCLAASTSAHLSVLYWTYSQCSRTSQVNGFVVTSLGWKYCFIIIIPFFALSLIFMLLAMPETSYDRVPSAPIARETDSASIKSGEKMEASHHELATQYPPAKTWIQEMKLWSGYKSWSLTD